MRRCFPLGLTLAFIAVMALPGRNAQAQVQPAQARPLSLDDAIQIALKGHPAVREAEDAVTAAEAEVKQARANYFPQLSFSGIAKVGLSGATGALGLPGFPASPFYRNLAYSANWYQNIFDFGRTKHLVASQRALAESARFKSKAEQERIVLAVKRSYFAVLEAQQLQCFAEATMRERSLRLNLVQASFQQGLQSQMELSQADASSAEAEASLAAARSAVGKGLAALRVAMGVDGVLEYELQAPQIEVVKNLPPLEDLVQMGIKNRPDAQAMEWKVRAFAEQADLAHSERLPAINGFGAGGQGRFNGTTVKPDQQHGVGAEQQRRAASEALLSAQARYKVQLASLLDVSTAEAGKTAAETSYARAQFDYQRACAALEFAIGKAPGPR